MSRVGNTPILLPDGVQLKAMGDFIFVKGPLGELKTPLPKGIELQESGREIQLKRTMDDRLLREKHGMTRAILNNSVIGVCKGWTKNLVLIGVGYRAQLKGSEIIFSLGFSHDVRYKVPDGIKANVTDQTKIELTGTDRQQVGQVAAEIRSFRPPEPYKGKGIRYKDEAVRRKAGKAGKVGKK